MRKPKPKPDVTTYNGIPIRDMTREQLLELVFIYIKQEVMQLHSLGWRFGIQFEPQEIVSQDGQGEVNLSREAYTLGREHVTPGN